MTTHRSIAACRPLPRYVVLGTSILVVSATREIALIIGRPLVVLLIYTTFAHPHHFEEAIKRRSYVVK